MVKTLSARVSWCSHVVVRGWEVWSRPWLAVRPLIRGGSLAKEGVGDEYQGTTGRFCCNARGLKSFDGDKSLPVWSAGWKWAESPGQVPCRTSQRALEARGQTVRETPFLENNV